MDETMKNRIIAGPITNLTDARYFAARGVWAIYFDLREDSSDYIPSYEALAIKEWIDVENIGFLVGAEHLEESQFMAKDLGIDFLLLTEPIPNGNLDTMETHLFWQGSSTELEGLVGKEKFEGFVIESFEFSALQNWEKEGVLSKCFLSLSQEKVDFEELYARYLGKTSWSLRGGEEEKVGYKSFEDLDSILDKMENDDII